MFSLLSSEKKAVYLDLPSSRPTWLAGKSTKCSGNTSSNGGFSVAVLVYLRVNF